MLSKMDKSSCVKIFCTMVLSLAVLMLSYPLFRVEASDIHLSDILLHIQAMQTSMAEENWFSYTILYPLIYICTQGSLKTEDLVNATVYLLTIFVVVKTLVTLFVLYDDGLSYFNSFIITLLIIFAVPIVNLWTPIYLGQISPTIWHNPTAILNIPFVILLFYFSIKFLKSLLMKDFFPVMILMLLVVITKPNYFLAYMPVFLIALCYQLFRRQPHEGIGDRIAILVIAFLPVIILLFYEYMNVYGGDKESSIIIAPLLVWRIWSANIPLSILVSVAFPLSVTVLYFREIKKDSKVVMAWAVFLVALLQAALFAETGTRMHHGNFCWGAEISLYILFLACGGYLMKQPKNRKRFYTMVILLLHFMSGLLYYYKIINGFGYA